MRRIVHGTVAEYVNGLEEVFPAEFLKRHQLPGIHETLSWRPRKPLFHVLLAAAFVLLLLYETGMVLRSAWRERRPAHA